MEPIDKSSNFTFTPSALFYIFEGRSTLCSSTVRFLTRLYPRRVFNILNSIDRYSRKKERVFGDFLSSERVLSFFIASVVARRCAIVDEINKTLDNRDPPLRSRLHRVVVSTTNHQFNPWILSLHVFSNFKIICIDLRKFIKYLILQQQSIPSIFISLIYPTNIS